MASIKARTALRKVADATAKDRGFLDTAVDSVSKWFAENPNWGRAALYGGGAFLGAGLLSALLGSKKSLGWAIPAALIAGAYGHQKPKADRLVKDYWAQAEPWVKDKANKLNNWVQNA